MTLMSKHKRVCGECKDCWKCPVDKDNPLAEHCILFREKELVSVLENLKHAIENAECEDREQVFFTLTVKEAKVLKKLLKDYLNTNHLKNNGFDMQSALEIHKAISDDPELREMMSTALQLPEKYL